MSAYSNQGTLTCLVVELGKRTVAPAPERVSFVSPSIQLKHRLTKKQIEAIVIEYEAGASVKTLMGKHRLGKGSVLKLLRDGGARIRQQRRLTETEVTTAVVWYRNGQSLARIGDQLGVNSTTVGSALERHGVPRRDCHGREK
jgi:hypothetical protein